MTPKTVLFVGYGGGHMRMLLPLAQALAREGRARPLLLGLTTAAPLVREAGLPLVQFADVIGPQDAQALAWGRQCVADLAAQGAPVADPEGSAAYLGLSYADLVAEHGEARAAALYAERGRQAFLPVRTLERLLRRLRPDLVVATNAPRAERAAIVAARRLGIPSVCLVDLFAVDEVQWIGAPDYADRVGVLNEGVRQFLLAAGRTPEQVCVTGNPAFDALLAPEWRAAGQALGQRPGWQGRKRLLWASQVEPARHPFAERAGDPGLPGRILQSLVDWTLARQDTLLCVRARPGEAVPALPADPRITLTGQDWPLPGLLHACDLVVTLTSTVGLEGHLAGARLVQVLGSVFDDAMPLARHGVADAAVPLAGLPAALDHWVTAPRRPLAELTPATPRALALLNGFL